MLKVERAFVRECIREYYQALGISSKSDAILAISMTNRALNFDDIRAFVYEQPFKGDKDAIATAALHLFAEKRSQVISYMLGHSNLTAASYLDSLISSYANNSEAAPRRELAGLVSDNWRISFASGDAAIKSGVYQLFRRFKPRVVQSHEGGRTTKRDPENILITELMYFDAHAMECVLITSEGNVYWGSLHLNHNHVLYAILQRPEEGAQSVAQSVHHRFYAVHTRLAGAKRRDPLYSGLYIKTGDFTQRPLCGECLFKYVQQPPHQELYAVMLRLFGTGFAFTNVADHDDISPYLSGFDGIGQEGSAVMDDVPLIREIAGANGNGDVLFREPTRALDAEVLEGLATEVPLSVFQHGRTKSP